MIILASKSPRRKQLLSMMGLEFTVQTADIDETMDPSQTPAHEVAAVSARKAEKIAALLSDKTGFVNQYYFSTSFKKKYGISPTQYRDALINGHE